MYDESFNEITNINAYSKSFDFLADEPEVYSASDLKKTGLTHTPPALDARVLPLLGENKKKMRKS